MEDFLKQKRLLPLYTVKDIEECVQVGKCLANSGLSIIEVAFRSELAQEGIRELKHIPGLIVGAGTVKTMEELQQALEAGADFIVSPGSDATIIDTCLKEGIPIFPGIVTPSELLSSYTNGLRCYKFFPASSYGGVATLKALHGPFPNVSFLPTGGIDESNYKEYLDLSYVAAVGGSFILPNVFLQNKDWDGLTKHIRKLLAQAQR